MDYASKTRLLIHSIALIFAASLMGCTPHIPPEFTNGKGESAPAFPGIKQVLASNDVRIVWIHGMCSPDTDWAKNIDNTMVKTLGLVRKHPGNQRLKPVYDTMGRSAYTLISDDYHISGSMRRNVEQRFLVWSPITNSRKHDLDERSHLPQMASFNRWAKQKAIHDCLGDPLFYSTEPTKGPIHSWMKEQICSALDGKMRSTKCAISGRPPNRKTIFISQSLGSKILIDAMNSIANDMQSGAKFHKNMTQQLAEIPLMFMLANQLPLLNLGDPATKADTKKRLDGTKEQPSATPDLSEMIQTIQVANSAVATSRKKSGQAAESLPPLHVVQFSDPNDLLSYELRQTDVPRGTPVTNIKISVAADFGVFANPLKAHTGHLDNRCVLKTIIDGYPGGKLRDCKL